MSDDTSASDRRLWTLDNALNVALGILLVGILTVGSFFAYGVWTDRQAAINSNPAYRLINDLKGQIRQYPNEAALRVRMGELLVGVGKHSEAIEQFENALLIAPEHTGAFMDLGIVAMMTDDYDAARRYFFRVLEITEGQDYAEINNRRDSAFFNLGRIALSQSEYEDAIGYFKESLRIRRDASDTYYFLARAYNGLGEQDAAIEQLEYALAFDPNFPQAHFLMGQIYFDQGDMVNASSFLYRAAELAPDADPPAEALAALGMSEEWELRARAALEAEDVDEALEAALVSRNLDPENVSAILLHGEVLEIRGNLVAAVEVYEIALELDPVNKAARLAIERLGGPDEE